MSHSLLYLLTFGIPNDTRACRLPQVSGQCYTLSTSKHMSILSDHEIRTSCVSGICEKTCDFFMPGLSTYDVRLSNYTFWGCCHASIHCLSIAGTRIHRSHEAHDEGMAFDESTPVGNLLSHESTFFSGCAMISIVAFCLTFS